MKTITVSETLKVDNAGIIGRKLTETEKLQIERNEAFQKAAKQAKTLDVTNTNLNEEMKLMPMQNNETEGVVRTIDLCKESNPEKNDIVPMAFPKSVIENVAKGNLPMTRAAGNDNPNGAYTIALETLYTDSVSVAGDQRWYNFQITEQKKLTVFMSSVAVATIDNDLALYKLNTSDYTLSMVSQSQNRAGMYELLSYIADPGIYYICVSSYMCSAANNYNFLARISNTWDASEADDSMALAEELPLATIIRRTLDNSLDEDCNIWLVDKTGNYRLEFFGVPENCNYELQILDSNQQILTTIPKNSSTNFPNVAAGGFFVRVLAPDGVVDSTAEYGILLVRIPDGLTDLTQYKLMFTDDKKHFVEYVSFPIENVDTYYEIDRVFVVYIDGVPFDVKTLDMSVYRAYTQSTYYTNHCEGTANSDAAIIGVYLGSYASKEAAYVKGLKTHTLMITVFTGVYMSYHMMRTYNTANWPTNPDSYFTGTDEFHNIYYQGYWSDVRSKIPVAFIVDVDDKGKCIDLYKPNWFYGSIDSFKKTGTEEPSFSYQEGDGTGWMPTPPYEH